MSDGTPVRDFLLPRLIALLGDAQAQGFKRQVAVAVLIDLVTSPSFDTAAPDPTDDSPTRPDYERGRNDPPMVHGVVPGGAPAIDAQDEADFVRPLRWDQ